MSKSGALNASHISARAMTAAIIASMGRYKSSDRMKFGLPLATAESKQVFHCYATHGKAYGRAIPNFTADVRIVVINAAREAHWEDATFDPYKRFQCAALNAPHDWRRLGWAMADGSLPFGELEPVDPLLAQYNFLQGFNNTPHQQPHGPPHVPGCNPSMTRSR